VLQFDKVWDGHGHFACEPVSNDPPPRMRASSIPNGPSISTVGLTAAGENRPFLGAAGGRIVKLTSGGIDNGARPICDGRFVDAENDRDWATGKAGRRNAGMEMEGAEAIALSSPFERAVESIANMLSSCLGVL